MAQTTNYEIANSSGLVFRGRVNEVFAAVQSNNSGATEPTGTVAYQLWYDTTTNILKMRNSSNSAWISLFTVDQTDGVWSVNANSTSNALRITQTGTGNALLVEDSANPDSTPFVITGAGDVGIGTSSPSVRLDVIDSIASVSASTDSIAYFGNEDTTSTATTRITLRSHQGDSLRERVHLEAGLEGVSGGYLGIWTRPTGSGITERARIDSSGNFFVGTTSLSTTSTTDTGGSITASGAANFFRAGNTPLIVMRQTNDGTLVDLRQGGASEGSISVSGTTVSYNGGHLSRWAQFPDNSRPELLKGTVMSNLDQMSSWGEEDNEQLNCVQVSTVEGDANVAGVFVAWESTDDGYNDILLAMTGDMVIRIGAGVTVARGDLLMSAGDGTAKPQGDDIVRSKTIAKVTSTHVSHTYADGSYAVPCVLMAC